MGKKVKNEQCDKESLVIKLALYFTFRNDCQKYTMSTKI